MEKMRKQLIELLNIHGVSGEEESVRNYLIEVLPNLVDNMEIDLHGNLLASKQVGNGTGATILLSAHMDTVKNVLIDRNVIETNGIFKSDKGALGADDRAGIAIILEVLRNVDKISFDGNIKIAFSVEEEIGCVGSNKINPDWYSDVDLAIVVDRRGNRDIVVGCYDAFCSNQVGEFFEEVSKMQGMNWKATEGGISDALIFSRNGINSVNLSVGYYNEHTDKEFLVFNEMKDTVKLIVQALAIVNTFYLTFDEVPYENKWVNSLPIKRNYNYYDEIFESDLYAEAEDINGDVFIYEASGEVIIEQDNNEIILSRESLKSLMKQLAEII